MQRRVQLTISHSLESRQDRFSGEARPRGTEGPPSSEARQRSAPAASTALCVHPSAKVEQLSRDLLDDLIAVGIAAGGPPLPTRENGGRRVLVYATRTALEHATRLLPDGTVLEVEVARAITRGDVDASQKGGFVFLDEHGLVARCIREPGRLRPRPRSWTVVEVAKHRGRS
jgi:hypothetical protein